MTSITFDPMNAQEKRTAAVLAVLYMLRMLGLFMVLPVIAPYAQSMPAANPWLIGLAVGVYGLSQALLQIPFGLLSDRFGRRQLITIGLLLFALGSVVAALATSIHWLIVGRMLQGCGAIAAVLLAIAADTTRPQHRSRVMAILGISIGATFLLSMVIGPLLKNIVGVAGLFWLTALLALGGLLMFWLKMPVLPTPRPPVGSTRSGVMALIKQRELLRLNGGIFCLHASLTASFVAVPLWLANGLHWPSGDHWWFYLVVLLPSVAFIFPALRVAEQRRQLKSLFLAAIVLLVCSGLWLWILHGQLLWFVLGLILFFAAFNVLEASLPSLVSMVAPPQLKGTALGIYSSFQFFGAFVGGALGGAMYGLAGPAGVFGLVCLLAGLWFYWARNMAEPSYLTTLIWKTPSQSTHHWQPRLEAVAGVNQVVAAPEQGIVYLKVDARAVDRHALEKLHYQFHSDYSDDKE